MMGNRMQHVCMKMSVNKLNQYKNYLLDDVKSLHLKTVLS